MADVPTKKGDLDPEADTQGGPAVWTHDEKMLALWPSREASRETNPATP